METAVVLLNFGEPEEPTEAEVVPFLERIFTLNASLEGNPSQDEIVARSRELARARAPGLIEEYRRIGGSPLNAQARQQADALRDALGRRGHSVRTYVGMQFTEPSIPAVVSRARDEGVERLVALPVYPLCGASTTVAALGALAQAVSAAGWDVEVREISGWHTHPDYIALRADGIRATAEAAGIDLNDRRARLVFSAHGTPMKYIREGNRYDVYVNDCCRRVAAAAGVRDYEIGYQNHTNRPVEWTQPDIEHVIETVKADAVVVVPISFMHEQSETLAELDLELREEAEARGLAFHRVPVPHDSAEFAEILADIVEERLGEEDADMPACRCRVGARCRNSLLV